MRAAVRVGTGRWRPSLAALGLAVASLAAPALALEVPAAPTARVNDYAGALSPDARARLEDQIRRQTAGRTYQVAVAIFPSLEGEALEDFSIRLAEKWKIGSRQHDDGVILVVFMKEHKARIEVGYGAEARLPDAIASRIIRERIAPRFRAGDVEGGLRDALAAIHQALTGQALPGQALPGQAPAGQTPPSGATDRAPGPRAAPHPVAAVFQLLKAVFFLALFVVILFLRFRGGGGFFIGGGGGWSSMGGGGFSGGGFSGGGGSFGGGGASGGW